MNNSTLRHMTFIEELHNLIGILNISGKSSDEAADPRGHAGRFLIKYLAEVRDRGEGLGLVDQSPSAIAADILKNAAIKACLRLVYEDDRDAMASCMLLDACGHEELARQRTGELFEYAEHLYRSIQARSLNPLADAERPREGEIFDIIRDQPWFQEGREERLKQVRASLDQVLANLKQLFVSMVKTARIKQGRQYLAKNHSQFAKAVRDVRTKMEDILGAAMLDRSLRETASQLEILYRQRMKALIEEASRILLQEENHG